MIKSQVYAGIALALLGLMLFVAVSPLLYYESPIGIHVGNRLEGSFQAEPNTTVRIAVNTSNPYLVVGYNYTVGPIDVHLENGSSSLQPIGVQKLNRTVFLDYRLGGGAANLTISFHNNASQTQTINYIVVGLRFGNLVLYTLIGYVELAMFVGGIAVAVVGALRKPKKI